MSYSFQFSFTWAQHPGSLHLHRHSTGCCTPFRDYVHSSRVCCGIKIEFSVNRFDYKRIWTGNNTPVSPAIGPSTGCGVSRCAGHYCRQFQCRLKMCQMSSMRQVKLLESAVGVDSVSYGYGRTTTQHECQPGKQCAKSISPARVGWMCILVPALEILPVNEQTPS